MVTVRPLQLRGCVRADALVGSNGTVRTRAAAANIIDFIGLFGRFRMTGFP
jgi:hypothetical protein